MVSAFLSYLDRLIALPTEARRKAMFRARAIVIWSMAMAPVGFVMAWLAGVQPGAGPLSAAFLAFGSAGILGAPAVLWFSKDTTLAGLVFGLSTALGLSGGPLLTGDAQAQGLILLAATPVIFGFMIGWKACLIYTLALLIYLPLVFWRDGTWSVASVHHLLALCTATLGSGFSTVVFTRASAADARRLARLSADNARLAHRDPLTGLRNRRALMEDLSDLVGPEDQPVRSGDKRLLLLDLDGFKTVNDTLGHHAGDALLCETAERLRAGLPAWARAYRLGGDEFAVLLTACDGDRDAISLGQRLLSSVGAPATLGCHDMGVSASVGVSLCFDGSVDTLVKQADYALHAAKTTQRGDVVLFNASLGARKLWRSLVEQKLRPAIDSGAIRVAFQPQHDLQTGRIVGHEALARWTDPDLGDVSPADFIPIAETSRLVALLDRHILAQSLAARAAMGPEGGRLSVNVSARTVSEPDFADHVAAGLAEADLPADLLELELTETALIQSWTATQTSLTRLRDLGVRIAVDDFGTGYSSLSYLIRFPIQTLKIDRSFLESANEPRGLAVIRSLVRLAEDMGLCVIAEGIETPAQAGLLRGLGCRIGQGFYYSRPSLVPADPATAEAPSTPGTTPPNVYAANPPRPEPATTQPPAPRPGLMARG